MLRIPFLRPSPPSLSVLPHRLEEIERSGVFSNNGPTNRLFESRMVAELFGGRGHCATVCNATLGLMLAIRAVLETAGEPAPGEETRRRYALMPSFTFAATAQAAVWNGLTPLFCDIDPRSWLPDPASEDTLIRRHGDDIAVIVPYATFGAPLDLRRYEAIAVSRGIPVVVDAAASLGCPDDSGLQFGAGSPLPIVFSMHATKPFGTAEAGLVYSADAELVGRIRRMANFGLDPQRAATSVGLNAKLSEVGALLALARLDEFDGVVQRLASLERLYRSLLPAVLLQDRPANRYPGQFMPVLLPAAAARERSEIIQGFAQRGIGVATYFSPHLAEQPFLKAQAAGSSLFCTDAVAGRMLSLPLWDGMTPEMVAEVCGAFTELALSATLEPREGSVTPPSVRRTVAVSSRGAGTPVTWDPGDAGMSATAVGLVVVGAGPAGIAPLLAASRHGLLDDLLAKGVVLVEREPQIGSGRLGEYAIGSDSGATTFLSCVTDHPVPALAALAEEPAARAIASYGAGSVPLTMVGRFMASVARAVAGLVAAAPRGRVLTGHEVVHVRRVPGGAWIVRLRCGRTGRESEILSRQVLSATGAAQSQRDLRTMRVGGVALLPAAGSRLVRSEEVLRFGGAETIVRRLRGVREPRIVVVGGSTSAVSVVRRLLDTFGDELGPDSVVLAHRRPLRLFFTSAEEARTAGYRAFGERDICALSGFVFRFGGLRYAARDTVAAALGVRGVAAEPRLKLFRLPERDDDGQVERLLAEADLVVAATGYRPRGLCVLDEEGERVGLMCEHGNAPMVGPDCAVLDENGMAIPNLFGIGLAAGYRPPETMGGEASFDGQVNGLWLWQNDVGLSLVRQLLAPSPTAAGSSRQIA
ncbi:MAG: DegT/DnrJ/EryC1/StrS family aminotransferase [Gluconacetobacter diazotrophicus]|nr:DegT/DnrJ/EryC1/StrS family aminotransferase [Gluconacetobacter diazotrophicus]